MKYIIAVMLICMASLANAFSYTQEFTEVQLQDKIDLIMPLDKKKYFLRLTISDPVIDLHETSNQLSIQANIEAKAFGGIKGSGTIHIAGSVSYNPETGTFHLQNPQIMGLSIQNVSERYQPKIKQLAQTVVQNALDRYPLYTLQDDNLKHKLLRSTLESVLIQDEKLQIKLSVL